MMGHVNVRRRSEYGGSWYPVIVIIFLILVLGLCCQSKKDRLIEAKKSEQKSEAPAINVVTMTMVPGTIRDKISFPGSLAPKIKLEVSTEVAGSVTAKNLSEGTWVDQGAVLGTIDSSKYISAYNAAKASYEAALSSKNRLEKLYRSELSNKSDLDAIIAQMENHRSSMRIAAIDLENCSVKAPISGYLNHVYVEKGQFLDKGVPFAEIIQTDTLKVKVGIPESDVTAVMGINEFNVNVDALGGRNFKATKNHLRRTTSSLARVYDLELNVDNREGVLLPDMFVRVDVVKKTVENALAVPMYSVISVNNTQQVFVAKENPKKEMIQAALDYLGIDKKVPIDTAFSREVRTGIQDGWMVEITNGLNPGDHVITVGQRSVSDGQKISVIRTQDEQEALVR